MARESERLDWWVVTVTPKFDIGDCESLLVTFPPGPQMLLRTCIILKIASHHVFYLLSLV